MQEMLKQYGYVLNDNEWKKLEWTVRFDDEKIEAFDDFLYFCKEIKNIELKDLLDDIDKHIEDSI